MGETSIVVRELGKTYHVPIREAGLRSSIQSLWARRYREVEAVKGVSFTLDKGEVVGFLGPNGAGKTTTLKMLSGLLYPSSGQIEVLGYVPWQREAAYLRSISMIMGNKSQMLWDIPALDTFYVLGEIYRVSRTQVRARIDDLVDLLDMRVLLPKPVRNLSLGERMKCELVASLLHHPSVLFLDEPTLGLDITMQQRLREFIAEYNRRQQATVLLTSHYMADVVALCQRVIVINHGVIAYDGSLQGLVESVAAYKKLRIVMSQGYEELRGNGDWPEGVEVRESEGRVWTFHVAQEKVAAFVSYLVNRFELADLTIEEPSIESVIEQLYQGGVR